MLFFYLSLFMGMATGTQARTLALPEVAVPPEWRACKIDADCVIAGDACRSCGDLIAIHRDYAAKFRERDIELRKKAGVVIACEACSTSQIRLRCERSVCTTDKKLQSR